MAHPTTAEYQGFKNWSHYEVHNWICNDEYLYMLAVAKVKEATVSKWPLRRAARRFIGDCGMGATPSGARLSVCAVLAALESVKV